MLSDAWLANVAERVVYEKLEHEVIEEKENNVPGEGLVVEAEALWVGGHASEQSTVWKAAAFGVVHVEPLSETPHPRE